MNYTTEEMLSFANFLRDNFFVTGAPKLASYNTHKYPNSTIEEIFNLWQNEKEKK